MKPFLVIFHLLREGFDQEGWGEQNGDAPTLLVIILVFYFIFQFFFFFSSSFALSFSFFSPLSIFKRERNYIYNNVHFTSFFCPFGSIFFGCKGLMDFFFSFFFFPFLFSLLGALNILWLPFKKKKKQCSLAN